MKTRVDNALSIMSRVQNIPVSEDDNDLRLDKWFKRYFPHVGHVHIQKIIRKGDVRVDGKRAKGETRVLTGQNIRVPPLPDPTGVRDRSIRQEDVDYIKSLVLYKDDHVIAINKPAGLPTQGGTGIRKHVDGLLEGIKFGGQKPRLVHRLDKGTSGVLLLARTAQVAKTLGLALKQRNVRKYYWAITIPAPERNEGIIDAPLSRLSSPYGPQSGVDEEYGKVAITAFKVMERMGKRSAWVAFWPKTGRTHQIRVHAELMGTPILGDERYGAERLSGADISQDLHLHARRVILPHPSGDGVLDITAPLSVGLRKTWKYFELDAEDSSDPFEDLDA